MATEFMEEEKHVVTVDAEMGEFDAGNVEYRVESPDTAVEVEVIPTPPLATEENLGFSLRNVQSKMDDVQLKAAAAVKKRNVEGILHSHNSFDALSNPNMVLAASKMGVIIPDNDFVNIDVIRELEKFRNNNFKAEREGIVEAEENVNNMTLINANGVVTSLYLNWMEEGNVEEEDFTLAKGSPTMLYGRFTRSYSEPRAVLIHLPLPGALNARLVLVNDVLVKTRIQVFRHLDAVLAHAECAGTWGQWHCGKGGCPPVPSPVIPARELVGALGLRPGKGAFQGLWSSSRQGRLAEVFYLVSSSCPPNGRGLGHLPGKAVLPRP
ncbi:hypothetical protein D1007_59659 [Hordeum vulgare]|nr:hypothetical protein D1007_59659 [Hordeum vulgare]